MTYIEPVGTLVDPCKWYHSAWTISQRYLVDFITNISKHTSPCASNAARVMVIMSTSRMAPHHMQVWVRVLTPVPHHVCSTGNTRADILTPWNLPCAQETKIYDLILAKWGGRGYIRPEWGSIFLFLVHTVNFKVSAHWPRYFQWTRHDGGHMSRLEPTAACDDHFYFLIPKPIMA